VAVDAEVALRLPAQGAPEQDPRTERLHAVPSAAGYRLGSDRGSPNQGSTLASKRVMAKIWPPATVST
jgi:hypothetical protein